MPKKLYVVTLTEEERADLTRLVSQGKAAARKINHARILLFADASAVGPAWKDEQIMAAAQVSRCTVERVRERFVEEGLEAALVPRPRRRHKSKKLDGKAEAYLIAAACGPPPEGRSRWTLKLLGERLVELEVVESVAPETIRQTLKKTS